MVPVCVLFIAHAYEQLQRFRRRRPRSCWVRPWIQRRARYGAYHCLVKELAEEDHTSYQNFVRMHEADFDDLLSKVAPIIRKQNSNMREAISPAERLSLTLRYLATGKRKLIKMSYFLTNVLT